MIYPKPQSLFHYLTNAGVAILVGVMFAAIGLNAAAGCGQSDGQCISYHDLTLTPDGKKMAAGTERHAG
ncbi:MAG TPA: hypothetical protein HPP80_06520 [Rhodospirillaceae bacterium]|nr:hypothetical protein [Rhodospirillaceae bacterium]